MDRIKIFICYSNLDGVVAGKIYNLFETYCGYEVFLAHEELSPSDDWPEEILRNLKKTDYVISVISRNFYSSSFANQEIGLGLAYGKRIIPISIDGSDPKGFIDKKQAHKCSDTSEAELFRAVTIIASLPIKHPKYKPFIEKNIESLLFAFEHSKHFKTTSLVIDSMVQLSTYIKFSKSQLDRIIAAYKTNFEIHGADWVTPKLHWLLKNTYGIEIDKRVIKQLQ